ncbi:25262_t:CDS:2 [Dentiscutata erythropus]|uniref:25262_t:CDS:1 n=1 Tax=Dentiscutata erythropus TaxID=1348616 RepID=A0A9N9E7J0_9GLOM|nr:25262_t:CDS:2 [Dentiscutata erythropus]
MDFPRQLNVRRAVSCRIKLGDFSGIPEQVLRIVPMIGPLHVSLNSRESKFERVKDPEARYLINLLDNFIPLVLDFYPVIFRSGNWPAY